MIDSILNFDQSVDIGGIGFAEGSAEAISVTNTVVRVGICCFGTVWAATSGGGGVVVAVIIFCSIGGIAASIRTLALSFSSLGGEAFPDFDVPFNIKSEGRGQNIWVEFG